MNYLVTFLILIFTVSFFISFSDSAFAFDDSRINNQSRAEVFSKLAYLPTIHIYGESDHPSSQSPFIEYKEGQLPWLDRLINEKTILANEEIISQYFEFVDNDEITIKYVFKDKPAKYYHIRLSDSDLSLSEHNIRAAYLYFTPEKYTSFYLDKSNLPKYYVSPSGSSKEPDFGDAKPLPVDFVHLFLESDWIMLSGEKYSKFQEFTKENGLYYEILEKDHAPRYFQIVYIGPDSDEVQQGLFTNRQPLHLNIAESRFDIEKPQEKDCKPVSSHNESLQFLSFYERFSVIDKTKKQVRNVDLGDSITIQYNPYNDWAESTPYVFEFGIKQYNGYGWFTIHTEKKTISEPLCNVEQGFQWVFTPTNPGEYNFYIKKSNMGHVSEIDRDVDVKKLDVFNALDSTAYQDLLDSVNVPGYVKDIYKVTSHGGIRSGVSFDDIDWSGDDSFIVYARHDRCRYIDDPTCSNNSLWKLDLTKDSRPQQIILPLLGDGEHVSDIHISPDSKKFAAYLSHHREGEFATDLFIYNFESGKLTQVTDGIHVSSFDWMPDGSLLYHEAVSQNAGILWQADDQGNTMHKVYEGSPNFGYLDVSPDGTKVSFRPIQKEYGRTPPPPPGEFEVPGKVQWFDLSAKQFGQKTIRSNIHSLTEWAPDEKTLYYMASLPGPPFVGKLDTQSGDDIPIITSTDKRMLRSNFAIDSHGSRIVFSQEYVQDGSIATSITIADLKSPSSKLVAVSEPPLDELKCAVTAVYLNGKCVSEKYAIQQGCHVSDGQCVFDPVRIESTIFEECKRDLDWYDKPCFKGDTYPGIESEKQIWLQYGHTKGDLRLQLKLDEINALQNTENFQDWVEKQGPLDDSKNAKYYENNENKNIWYYYYLQGKVPHYITGKYIDDSYRSQLDEKYKTSDCSISYDEIVCSNKTQVSTGENDLKTSYSQQWITKLVLIGIIVGGVSTGIVIAIRFWRRK